MLLYHATTRENAWMILGYEEADPEFGEANGFKGGRVSGFEGCVFLSEKPINFGCVGGTYHVVVNVDEKTAEAWQYFEDDDNYHCKNFAIPDYIVNKCEMWLMSS